MMLFYNSSQSLDICESCLIWKKRAIADGIKLRILLDYPRRIYEHPSVSLQERSRRRSDKKRKRPCDHRCRDGSGTVINQRMLTATNNWKQVG